MSEIKWKAPWSAIQPASETSGLQRQLEREITSKHPLHGKGATAIGRRMDNDDILAALNDGSYVRVHLVWRSGPDPYPDRYPLWFSYGGLDSFLAAMDEDARAYGDDDAEAA